MFYKGERGVKVMLIIKLIISIVGAYIMGVIGSIEASSNYFTNRNNLGLNEILLFFSFTLSIAVILVMYYKSSSLKKLLNIFFTFSFPSFSVTISIIWINNKTIFYPP